MGLDASRAFSLPKTPRDFFAHRLDTYTNNLPSITQQSKFGPTHLVKKNDLEMEKNARFSPIFWAARTKTLVWN
jgi:hypothetical protein